MNGCGIIMGGNGGYKMVCGNLWCGEIVYCDCCQEKQLALRVLQKQEV